MPAANHLQAALQRCGRHDRRPAPRARLRGRTDHPPAGGGGRHQHRRRRGRARALPPRHRPCPRRRGPTARRDGPVQRALRKDRRRHRADLRPDLRHREAPPAQARNYGPDPPTRVHQPPGLRGLRRLLQSPTASRSSRWKPSSGASAGSTSPPAIRTSVASKGSVRAS